MKNGANVRDDNVEQMNSIHKRQFKDEIDAAGKVKSSINYDLKSAWNENMN